MSVKTRIGIDDRCDYEFLHRFVSEVAAAGCGTFIVHARKAVLSGLSPKQNREVPPLCYGRVQRVKTDFPRLQIIVNGGIKTLADVHTHLTTLDGVMIGREAYHNPYLLAELEREFFGAGGEPPSREEVVARFLPYVEAQLAEGTRLNSMTRHILGLYAGQPGARRWRRSLAESAHRPGAGTEVIEAALRTLPRAA